MTKIKCCSIYCIMYTNVTTTAYMYVGTYLVPLTLINVSGYIKMLVWEEPFPLSMISVHLHTLTNFSCYIKKAEMSLLHRSKFLSQSMDYQKASFFYLVAVFVFSQVLKCEVELMEIVLLSYF